MRGPGLIGHRRPALANIASVTVSGPLSITFTMKEPWIAFPYGLTSQAGMVAEPSTLKDGSAMQHRRTGPFVFSDGCPATISLHQEPNYCRAGCLPRLDHLPTDRRRRGAQQLAQVWHGPDDPLERRADDPRLHGNSSYKMITDLHKVIGRPTDLLDAQHGHTAVTDSRSAALAYASTRS